MTIRGSAVVVVGAGVGGMAASLLLARAGATVTLLERRASAEPEGAGILLQPNGLAVLAGLGLSGPLHAAGHAVQAGRIAAADGSPLLSMATPDFGDGLDHVLAVRRSALHDVLRAALAQEAGVTVRFGAEVVDAEPDGAVGLRSSQGSEWLAAALVVGADGVHSTVRALGDFGARSRPTGQVYLRALVPRREDLVLEGEYGTALGLVGGAAVDARTQYVYADAGAPPVAAALAAADLTGLSSAWGRAMPLVGRLLEGVGTADELLVNAVTRVDCRRWHDGRLVLLGDAAHAMAPTLGQGANSALVDALVLAEELSRAPQDRSKDGVDATTDATTDAWMDTWVNAALHRYEARRRPAVRRVQQRADAAARLAALRSARGRRIRDGLLRVVGRLPVAGERAMRAVQQEDPASLRSAVRALSPLGS